MLKFSLGVFMDSSRRSGDNKGPSEELWKRLESRDTPKRHEKGELNPTKEGFKKSEWMKSVKTPNPEIAGKTGAREQIRAQANDTDVTIQVIRQGAWSRALSVLLSPFRGSIGKRVIAEIHVKRELNLIDNEGKINFHAVRENLMGRQTAISEAKKHVDDLIADLDLHVFGEVMTDQDVKAYASLKTNLTEIKVALSKDNAMDKIDQLNNDINLYQIMTEKFISGDGTEKPSHQETKLAQERLANRDDKPKEPSPTKNRNRSERTTVYKMPPAPRTSNRAEIPLDETSFSIPLKRQSLKIDPEVPVEISDQERQQSKLNHIYKTCYAIDPSVKGRDELLAKTFNLMLRKSVLTVEDVEKELANIEKEFKALVKRADKGKEIETTPDVIQTESKPAGNAQGDLALHLSSLRELLKGTPKESLRYAVIESEINEIETRAAGVEDEDVPGLIHQSLEYISSLGIGDNAEFSTTGYAEETEPSLLDVEAGEEREFRQGQVKQSFSDVPTQRSFIGQRRVTESSIPQATANDPYEVPRGEGLERLGTFKSEIDDFPLDVKNFREAAWEILENRLKAASSQEEVNQYLEDIDKEHAVDNKIQEALAKDPDLPALAVIETIGKAALKILPQENSPETVASIKEDFERLSKGEMNRSEMEALIKKGDAIFKNLDGALLKKWEGFKHEAALNREAFDVLLNADSNHSLDKIEIREKQLQSLKGTGVVPFADSEFFDEGNRLIDELILAAYFDPSRKFHELNDQRDAWNNAARTFNEHFPLLVEASQANQEMKEALVEVYIQEINLKDVPGSEKAIEQLDRIAKEHISDSLSLAKDLSSPEKITAYTEAAKESAKALTSFVTSTKTKESVRIAVERRIASFKEEIKKDYLDVFDNLNSQYPSESWIQKKNHITEIMSAAESMDSWAQKNYQQNFSDLRPDQMEEYENFIQKQLVRNKESIERVTGLQSALEAEKTFSLEMELANATLKKLREEKKLPLAALELEQTINRVKDKLDGIIKNWAEKPMNANTYERALKDSQVELEKAVIRAEKAQKMSKIKELTELTAKFPDADDTHRLKNEYYDQNIQAPVATAMAKIEEYGALVDKLPNALKFDGKLRLDISRKIQGVEKEIAVFQTPPVNLQDYTGSDIGKLENRVLTATKEIEKKLENAVHLNAVIEASEKLKTQITETKDVGSRLEKANQFGKAKDLLNAISKAEDREKTLPIPKTAKELLTYKKEIERITNELKKDFDAIPEEDETLFEQLERLDPDSTEAIQLRGELREHYQIKLDNFQKELWGLSDTIYNFETDYLAFDPEWRDARLNEVAAKINEIRVLKESIAVEDVPLDQLENCRGKVKVVRQELGEVSQLKDLIDKSKKYWDKKEELKALIQDGQEANADRLESVVVTQSELLTKQFKDKPISSLRQLQSAAKVLEEAEGRLVTVQKTFVEDEQPLEQLEYFESKYGDAAVDKQGYQTVHKAFQRQIHAEIDTYIKKLDEKSEKIQTILIDSYNEDEKLVPEKDVEWAEVTYFIDELTRKRMAAQKLKEQYTQKNWQKQRGMLGLKREKLQEKDIVLTKSDSSELREYQSHVKREIDNSWANVEELEKKLPTGFLDK